MMNYVVLPFLTAVQFLTRLPVPGGNKPAGPEVFQRVVIYLPLVGLLIGAITALVFGSASLVFNPLLAAAIAVAVEMLVTGAFHEDAVADYFDAFGGGWSKEDILRILKDSRIGSYGASALIAALLLRIFAMASLEEQPYLVILASAALGRLATVLSIRWLKPIAAREGLAKEAGHQARWRDVLLAGLLILPMLLVWAWVMPLKAALSLLCAAGATLLVLHKIRTKIGGMTGDCLGMICYLTQVMVLLVGAANLQRLNWLGY
ncbi:MAG: adenosylcobinamide-GDP ribazoletransferase [Planctomycetota bacterium]|nr:MAG: adenosylcobinamide-GDP ribazoletransferase [Planctomycetota bacterium]